MHNACQHPMGPIPAHEDPPGVSCLATRDPDFEATHSRTECARASFYLVEKARRQERSVKSRLRDYGSNRAQLLKATACDGTMIKGGAVRRAALQGCSRPREKARCYKV